MSWEDADMANLDFISSAVVRKKPSEKETDRRDEATGPGFA
jgi:hypothetical protein